MVHSQVSQAAFFFSKLFKIVTKFSFNILMFIEVFLYMQAFLDPSTISPQYIKDSPKNLETQERNLPLSQIVFKKTACNTLCGLFCIHICNMRSIYFYSCIIIGLSFCFTLNGCSLFQLRVRYIINVFCSNMYQSRIFFFTFKKIQLEDLSLSFKNYADGDS